MYMSIGIHVHVHVFHVHANVVPCARPCGLMCVFMYFHVCSGHSCSHDACWVCILNVHVAEREIVQL